MADEEQGAPYPPTRYDRCKALGGQIECGLLKLWSNGQFTLFELMQVVEGVQANLQRLKKEEKRK